MTMGKVRDHDAEMAGALARQDSARKARAAAMLAKGGPGAPVKKVSKQKKKPKKLKNDRAVLGARVKIYWKTMKEWYSGTITHVDPEDEALTVTYDDGEELTYPPNFTGWRWRLLDA